MAYVPAMNAYNKFTANSFSVAKDTARWQTEMSAKWEQTSINSVETPTLEPKVGDRIPVTMKVSLGDIGPENVNIEVIAGNMNSLEQMSNYDSVTATKVDSDISLGRGQHLYKAEVICKESGRFGIKARIMPRNDNLIHNRIPKLIRWW